jgi:hypothetical protein
MMAAANKEFTLTAGGFAPLTRHTFVMVSHEEQLLGVSRWAVLGAKNLKRHGGQEFYSAQKYNLT